MRWKSKYIHPDGLFFIIEEQIVRNVTDQKDKNLFYLYVYDHKEAFIRDINDCEGNCFNHQQDHMQETLKDAQEQAYEDFRVPLNTWQQLG